ncbi:Probable transposable element [Penicillium roqueforti FM164]|uniref:Probable transposable element n=1 Tax=Penicillium roqueforti (strain FM164) TaxID=1365484 RepID=W6PTL2_PENRF|nr:Probable transposable element [Penicillium roqueforti FM164]
MQSTVLLEKEVSDLRATNEKQKQKCTRSQRQIHSEEGLSVQEASQLITAPVEVAEAPPRAQRRRPSLPLQPRTRALPTCGLCKTQGHRRDTCPNR